MNSLKIGAISRLSGIPVSTLRIWELRYGAFSPIKGAGGHRAYASTDLARAKLMKRLVQADIAISTIATLGIEELEQLLALGQTATSDALAAHAAQAQSVLLLVESAALLVQLKRILAAPNLRHLKIKAQTLNESEINGAGEDAPDKTQRVLLGQRVALDAQSYAAFAAMALTHKAQKTAIVYSYSTAKSVSYAQSCGTAAVQGPLTDTALATLIARLISGNTPELCAPLSQAAISPALFDETTLGVIANLPTAVLCECPQHVAHLVKQLQDFEVYSAQCLNKNATDAHLHQYLSQVAGTARMLFEQALIKVASHEGIDLGSAEAQSPHLA